MKFSEIDYAKIRFEWENSVEADNCGVLFLRMSLVQ